MIANSRERRNDLCLIDTLSPADQERLAEIVEQYMVAVEQGLAPDTAELCAQHADLAEPLRLQLEGLQLLHQATVEAAGHLGPSDLTSDRQRLDDYQIIRELGRGGMGVVYEARQVSLDRSVAIKVLPFAAALNSKQIARFRNEAQAAAQLHHPNIVPVYSVGCDRGVHFYAMQLVEGRSLDEVILSLQRDEELGSVLRVCCWQNHRLHRRTILRKAQDTRSMNK